jgi:prevent-host-death family protein
MPTNLTITKAREALTSLPERLAREPEAVTVTRRGEPVLAILPWELYETLEATLEILGDEELTAELRRSLREAEAGETVPWDEVKADLGL